MVIENIPAPGWTAIKFAAPTREPAALSNISANHPNGVSLTLNGIEFGEDFTGVQFLAVNGHHDIVRLADDSEDAYLQDEAGNKYLLIRPANGRKLEIPARQKMNGSIHFAGMPPATAKKQSLHLNARYGGTNENTTMPKIVVNDLTIGK